MRFTIRDLLMFTTLAAVAIWALTENTFKDLDWQVKDETVEDKLIETPFPMGAAEKAPKSKVSKWHTLEWNPPTGN